jgi:hypothetical protein
VRLIRGRVFVVPRTEGRIVLCLQDCMVAVTGIELHPPHVMDFLEQLEATMPAKEPRLGLTVYSIKRRSI